MKNEKKDKKIVFLIGSMGKGGAERVISILANTYASKGWKVDIFTLLDNSNDYNLAPSINIIPIFNKNKSRISQLPHWISSIRNYVVKNKPDKIVSFIARINIITLLSCIGLSQKVIVSERNDPKADGRSWIINVATSLLYPLADKIVFQTKWAQSCFSKVIQDNSIIIPNPIEVNSKATMVKKNKIVAVGRLIEQKNHSMLIQAFKKIHQRYPEYYLEIFGEGRLRNELENKIKELELTESVHLPGNVSNIHEEIIDSEMFILSSNYEGLSNALLEAMMIGIPCISTDCSGSNEVITHKRNGMLVPIGSEEKLFEAIEQLIIDKELAFKIGKEAEFSSKAFKSANVVKQWDTIIEI